MQYLNEKYLKWANDARTNVDDEFYTKMEYCIKEFDNYFEFFNNKVIYCNCDNPLKSNVLKYFKDNFDKLNLKCLYATWYGSDSSIYEFNGDEEIYIPIDHPHTGSFDSPESIEILKKSDIVVTNIPFSNGLPKAFLELMTKYNKYYITTILSLSLCNAWARPFIISGDIKPGFTAVKDYNRPDNITKNKKGLVDTLWITNIPIKTNKSLECNYTYQDIIDINNTRICDFVYISSLREKVLYIKKCKYIPNDYNDNMLVPYNFFLNYDNEEFDIITTVTTHKKTMISPAYNSGFIIKRK